MEYCHMRAKLPGASCYVHSKDCSYPSKTYCMDDTELQLFIRQEIDTRGTHDVIFSWQDCELTPERLIFFKSVIELQKKFSQDKKIINTLPINGTLLDDSWCEFFKENQFLISVEVDVDIQPVDKLHNEISVKSTNHIVEKTVRLLQKHDLEFQTVTVIDAINSQQPLQVYHYLRNLGSRHMLFIPFLKPLERGGFEAQSLSPTALGIFLKTIFYTWIRLDIGTIKIPFFEHTFAAWCGLSVPNCVYAPSDDSNQATATAMQEIIANQRVDQSQTTRVEECTRCKVEFACHGGCARESIALSQCADPQLNYFCEGYKAFFTYVEPYMLMMRALWEQSYAPSDIRQYLA